MENTEELKSETINETQVSNESELNNVKPMSERDFKIAYARALKERKEKIRQNKEMVADLELEVAYRKAQSDLLKYRYEHMDYFLKNLEIEAKYLVAKNEQQEKQNQAVLKENKQILD